MSGRGIDSGGLLPWLLKVTFAEGGSVLGLTPLSGGAIQENWRLDVRFVGGSYPGQQRWVLRRDAPVSLAVSHGRSQEFALLRVAFDAGIKAPEPLFLCQDPAVLGRDFYIMPFMPGTSEPRELLALEAGEGDELVADVGAQLAKLHALPIPEERLPFLKIPKGRPARARVQTLRGYLDALPGHHPTLEWALNWLFDNAPEEEARALCHLDCRTGNIRVEGSKVRGLFDWEFAEYASPMEDLGWFTARCWRFGANEREAGGIGSRDALYRGYEGAGGERVQDRDVRYYEVMAALRWAVVALQQGARAARMEPPSMLHALTGQMTPELELELLEVIPAWERRFKNG